MTDWSLGPFGRMSDFLFPRLLCRGSVLTIKKIVVRVDVLVQ